MGQNDSCGLCGKHYQQCSHYLKEHATNPDSGLTFCGRDVRNLISHSIDGQWYIDSIDPMDLCKICRKVTKWDNVVDDLYIKECTIT